jgi:hypothetical protein
MQPIRSIHRAGCRLCSSYASPRHSSSTSSSTRWSIAVGMLEIPPRTNYRCPLLSISNIRGSLRVAIPYTCLCPERVVKSHTLECSDVHYPQAGSHAYIRGYNFVLAWPSVRLNMRCRVLVVRLPLDFLDISFPLISKANSSWLPPLQSNTFL